jgi:hypothetical protein
MLRSRLLKLGALGIVATFALSCADSTLPTGPGTQPLVAPPLPGMPDAIGNGQWIPIQPTASPEGKTVRGVKWSSARNMVELSVTGTIGPAGGSLAIPGSDFVIHFPVGALTTPTTITIQSKDTRWVTYDMLPHGLVFATPVYVMQAIVNTTAFQTPGAFFLFGAYLADGQETVGLDDTATAVETAPSFIYLDAKGVPTWSVWMLSHFSRYMLASG